MRADDWDTISGWLTEWASADAAGRDRLRSRLAADHPHLSDLAVTLSRASDRAAGFLETPAFLLAAHELASGVEPELLPAGSPCGPYQIVELLARGGMGDIYRAIDTRLQRPVALKVLSRTRSNDPQRTIRFTQEARMTASLDHPHVIRVYDVGLQDDRAYLVTELLHGETLRDRIGRGPMLPGDVVRIGLEVARGLGAAHAAGLVHRDLKPENIFLTRSGTTKILDFGIAKLSQDENVRPGTSTLPGVVFGTAGYLAPEQIRGEAVDARADLFALGTVLFEMLTAARAFERSHIVETLHAILHDGVPDLLANRPDVSPALRVVITRLLEKSPDARFQSTADVIAALEAPDITTHAVASKRRPLVARAVVVRSLAVALIGVALAGVAIGWWSPRESGPAAPAAPVVLAVMPFRSIAAAGDGLEAGLTDVLISRLSRLSEIRVLPLTTTERLRAEEEPREVRRRLGATHILSGRLQRDNRFVRVTVQLVSTSDEHAVWSSPVDTDASTLFAIQDVIVTRVIEELVPQLPAGARRALAQPGTRSNEAYEAYVRGLAHAAKPARTELTHAVGLFQRAVDLDPEFADAWAALGTASRNLVRFDVVPAEGYGTAKRAALRALNLDANNGEAFSVLGTVAFEHEWDYREAERLLRRAVEVQPGSAQSYLSLAHLLSNIGRHDEALVEVRRARTVDPEWPLLRALEGQFLFMARRYEDSLARLDEVIAVQPQLAVAHIMRTYPLMALQRYEDAIRACDQALELNRQAGATTIHSRLASLRGYALARMGRVADAEQALAILSRQGRDRYVPPHHEALLLHALGRDREALARLQDAVEVRDSMLILVGVDPKWDGLRDAPEFRAVMARVNLLEVSDRARR
jgi:serine/threonine-protein kinase